MHPTGAKPSCSLRRKHVFVLVGVAGLDHTNRRVRAPQVTVQLNLQRQPEPVAAMLGIHQSDPDTCDIGGAREKYGRSSSRRIVRSRDAVRS